MENKNDATLGRDELADRLEALAASLRAGELEIDGRRLRVPDILEAKIGCKEKKGRIAFKLRWRWSTLEDYPAAEQADVIRWQDSMKTVKKRLNRSFADLKRAASQPGGPDRDLLERFMADSRAFAEMADPEWEEGMQAYADHLENLQRGVDSGQIEAVRHEVRDIALQLKACHKRFK